MYERIGDFISFWSSENRGGQDLGPGGRRTRNLADIPHLPGGNIDIAEYQVYVRSRNSKIQTSQQIPISVHIINYLSLFR